VQSVVVSEKGASIEEISAVATGGKKDPVQKSVAGEKGVSVANIAIEAPSKKKAPVQSVVAGTIFAPWMRQKK
jgi:hypothetical protein